MSQRRDLQHALESIRDSIQETLRETSQIKRAAIEEEILTGVANIEKTCNNALRAFGKAKTILRNNGAITKARH